MTHNMRRKDYNKDRYMLEHLHRTTHNTFHSEPQVVFHSRSNTTHVRTKEGLVGFICYDNHESAAKAIE